MLPECNTQQHIGLEMKDYKDKTKEELLEIIRKLEEQLENRTLPDSSCQDEDLERFRKQYGKEILDAIPDMLTVFDYNLDYIELLSSPDTNHVEGLSGEDKSHPNLKDIVPESEYRKIRANMEKVMRTGCPSIREHSLWFEAIVGFSRLVIDSGHEGDKEDYCNIIEKNSELLLCLFNDILDLSEMESGTLEFVREKVNLYHACLEEYDRHRLKVNKGVILILDDVDEELCVMGDRMRIMQVLMNLLSNAAKFTPTGEIHFGYQLRGNIVQFYVKDTGIGIPANRVAKIFERFGKINNFAQGTGLGLTVSRMLVERMGGRIWVRSGEGIGTTFFFTLPLG